MSRAGYSYDCDDPLQEGRWKAAVNSAMRGKRGQAFLREALAALDAMPDKILVRGALVIDGLDMDYDEPVIVGADVLYDRHGSAIPMGSMCLLGAVGKSRGLNMDDLDPDNMDTVAPAFGIADAMARELVYWNDEGGPWNETPEQRWTRMRKWVAGQIKTETPST